MTSALAAQLAQGASLNATLVAGSGQRRKAPAQSYLFTGREADKHDLESVHALGANGIAQLRTLDKRFTEFEESLFGEAAKSYDRTLRTKEENAKLDANVEAFLVLLGPWLLEAPAGKVLEWLVRRFR
jgi:U3 small nucleolar RNA-associated protein 10